MSAASVLRTKIRIPATAVGKRTPSAAAATTVTLLMFDTSAVAVPCVEPAAETAAEMLFTTKPFSVVVLVAPDTAEPMLMVVVEPETPAVPMFMVFVEPLVVEPAPKETVCELVELASDVVPLEVKPFADTVLLVVKPP